nr:reverse transcriptase domain-containing protein [Tanacetum cinerariifolium]
MDAHKSELAKRYSGKVPKTVDEMMTRLYDFVRSEKHSLAQNFLKEKRQKHLENRQDRSAGGKTGSTWEAEKAARNGFREEKVSQKGRELDESTNRISSSVDGRCLRRTTHHIVAMKGYLVRRVYVDQGSSVEVMFEHCFENLSPAIRSRLKSTQMDLVGFAGDVMKPLGKIELEVVFSDGGLFRTVMINFTIVRAPSPYNVIFGRTCLRSLRAVSSTIHSMVKFPTPRGIATLVTRSAIIFECQRLEKKKMVDQEVNQNINQEKEVPERVDLTEQTLVNPAYPDQLVTIKGNLLEECKSQLRTLLKSMDAFAWEPADMTGIPRRIIEHSLNVNPSIERNLEAYMDDMVIKSNDEKVLIVDIAETFESLRMINMKLNPKKCSFGVEEGKFMGYMVTSERIRDNPKNTKAIADMQSPRTLKEMEPKWKAGCIKKIHPDEYRWTESAKKVFQEMKKVIVELPLLTTLVKEETLYVYVAAATEAVSAVLLTEIKGKHCPIHYEVTKILQGSPHQSHNGPSTQADTKQGSRVKKVGQVLANFLLEALVGTPTREFFRLPAKLPNKDDVERWTLFTDDASNSKGFEAGLVLISPSGVEFTYAL